MNFAEQSVRRAQDRSDLTRDQILLLRELVIQFFRNNMSILCSDTPTERLNIPNYTKRLRNPDLIVNVADLDELCASGFADFEGATSFEGPGKRYQLGRRIVDGPVECRALFRVRPTERGIALLRKFLPGYDKATPTFEAGNTLPKPVQGVPAEGAIFIGHGHSREWLQLEKFLRHRLGLNCLEFNSDSPAGLTTPERLTEMLESANFAFLVMTAEDQHADGSFRARENVVHEVGLFQGRLGFRRAIVLLEHGCQEFSNITGLTWISFSRGNIGTAFEEIRRVLEKAGLLANGASG